MKRILKVVSGLVAVAAAACLLAAPAQARTFVSVNVRVGGGYGGGYGCAPRYAAPCAPAPVYVAAPCAPAPCYVAAPAPCYPVGYGYRAPVCYRPAVSVGCFFPQFHFSGFWR